MKSVTNKTNAPVKVPLPQGMALHLGPRKTGQIRDEDASRPAVKKLVDARTIEIFHGGSHEIATGSAAAPHESTHGLGKSTFKVRKVGSS